MNVIYMSVMSEVLLRYNITVYMYTGIRYSSGVTASSAPWPSMAFDT